MRTTETAGHPIDIVLSRPLSFSLSLSRSNYHEKKTSNTDDPKQTTLIIISSYQIDFTKEAFELESNPNSKLNIQASPTNPLQISYN
jgi:hypothetical protein